MPRAGVGSPQWTFASLCWRGVWLEYPGGLLADSFLAPVPGMVPWVVALGEPVALVGDVPATLADEGLIPVYLGGIPAAPWPIGTRIIFITVL